jgi:hypothetical protein
MSWPVAAGSTNFSADLLVLIKNQQNNLTKIKLMDLPVVKNKYNNLSRTKK